MLWFRTGAVVSSAITMFIGLVVLACVLIMCVNPSNGRAMNTDPYYNGTLSFYVVVIVAQMFEVGSTIFGLVLAFRIWRNNHQMDHKLRRLFSIWLSLNCAASLLNFIMGILGLVRYREPQEEIMSLFEIFSKYNQDVKFVGSFEKYQRENSCCGINGPDDWMLAQFKQGGGTAGGMSGMSGGYDSYMGSPSTGKCHLTPPTIPMGCGKKMLEDIHFTQTCYSAVLILETLTGLATAALGWYCFFYWIEKEVIIIPEDEVSNLIVIEPESTASSVYTVVTDSGTLTDWSGRSRSRSRYSGSGSRFSASRYSQSRLNSQSRFSRLSGSRGGGYAPSQNPYPQYPPGGGTESGMESGMNPSYYPNTVRPQSPSRFTKLSNIHGIIPSVGGPHSAFLSMQMIDPNDEAEKINQNTVVPSRVPRSVSEAVVGGADGPSVLDEIRLHQGPQARSVVYSGQSAIVPSAPPGYAASMKVPPSMIGPPSMIPMSPSFLTASRMGSSRTRRSTRGSLQSGSYMSRGSKESQPKEKPKKTKLVKKVLSPNHILHKQEKALGGRVLAEMRIDHSRDPQPMNENMSASHVRKGHRVHHATLALIKNKKPPQPQSLFAGPERGHGQTGHLANDILAMSGGAGAAKSMIDNINLRVDHDSTLLEGEGYLAKKKRERKGKGRDHPDKDNPGHGPVMAIDGVINAPSADGSQAQFILDNILNVAHDPPPKEPSEEIIPVHETKEPEPEEDHSKKGKHHKHDKHHHDKHHHSHGHHHGGNHHHHHAHQSHSRHHHGHHDNYSGYYQDSRSLRSGGHHHHGHHNHSHGGHSRHHDHHGGHHSTHHRHHAHGHGHHHGGHHSHATHHHRHHRGEHHGHHQPQHHGHYPGPPASLFFPGSMAGSVPGSAGSSMPHGSSQYPPETQVIYKNDHPLE